MAEAVAATACQNLESPKPPSGAGKSMVRPSKDIGTKCSLQPVPLRSRHLGDKLWSVTRQIENARAFAARKGWTVAPSHIFVDDGISRAEFKRRPGFQRLMVALESKPPFQVLIVSEQESIGREAFETDYTIRQISQAGVEIFEYVHGQSLTPKNQLDRLITAIRAGADDGVQAVAAESPRRPEGGRPPGHRRQHTAGGRRFGTAAAPAATPLELAERQVEEAGLRIVAETRRSRSTATKQVRNESNDY